MRRLVITITLVSSLLLLAAATSASAETLAPWWHLSSTTRPTDLQPGHVGEVVVTAVNLGDAIASVEAQPIVLTDKLPAGLKALSIEGYVDEKVTNNTEFPLECSTGPFGTAPLVSCTFAFKGHGKRVAWGVAPYYQLQMRILVEVQAGAEKPGATNVASVSGGEGVESTGPIPGRLLKQPLTVGSAPTPFGVNGYELRPEAAGGAPTTQAGKHPFQLTTTLQLNEAFEPRKAIPTCEVDCPLIGQRPAGALTKDLRFNLPPGLIGNPTAIPTCSLRQFLKGDVDCPEASVIGVARTNTALNFVLNDYPTPFPDPLFNLEPAPGEPARFGFRVNNEVPIVLDTSVRTGSDYGVTVTVANIPQSNEFLSSEVTFWGVPGARAHDNARGRACFQTGYDNTIGEIGQGTPAPCSFEELNPPPLLALPTSCPVNPATGQPEPLRTEVFGDSWAAQTPVGEPLPLLTANTAAMPAMDGCNALQFEPSIKVTPDDTQASKADGAERGRARRSGIDPLGRRPRGVRCQEHHGRVAAGRRDRPLRRGWSGSVLRRTGRAGGGPVGQSGGSDRL